MNVYEKYMSLVDKLLSFSMAFATLLLHLFFKVLIRRKHAASYLHQSIIFEDFLGVGFRSTEIHLHWATDTLWQQNIITH